MSFWDTQNNPLLSAPGADQNQQLFGQFGFHNTGWNEIKPQWQRFAQYLYPMASQDLGLMNQLQDPRHQAILDLVNQMGQGGQNAMMHQEQAAAGENAANAGRQDAFGARAMGMGDGFQAGAMEGANQQGAMAQNQIAQNYASPQHHLAALQSLLQGAGYGYQSPAFGMQQQMYEPFNNSHQIINQEHQSMAQGMMGGLGSVLGAVGSIYGGGMGGGIADGLLGGGGGGFTGNALGRAFSGMTPMGL